LTTVKKTFFEKFRQEFLSLLDNNKKIFVAYSGGVDSHVLLHLLVLLQKENPKLKLTAIHVDHNLSPNANKWDKHCKKTCKDLGVDYVIKNVNAKIKLKDHSPEEIARKLRYEVFAKALSKNAILVTAHHSNDQAETLLLQLFRGAGPKGLASMPMQIKFAKGRLVRPLLNFMREELLQYAKANKLKWIEDESNTNLKYGRNFVRHKLMPIVKKQWPGITAVLNRVANHCAQADELLESLAAEDLVSVAGGIKDTINITHLKKLPLARQRNVLRFWLHSLKLSIPSEAKLNEVTRTVVNSRSDAVPVVKWDGAEIRRFQNHLYAMQPLLPHDNKTVLRLYLNKPLKLPGDLGVLRAKIKKNSKADVENKIFTVRFRLGGEKIKLPGRQGTHLLKKLMQEWEIPPWMRERILLVYCGEEVVAVIGYYNNSKDLQLDVL
jgi:tRNA(Ile)-lysidine synthase